ncbi:MAG: hypothetical protein QW379_06180 [Thermoplasmata archaeon]
MTPDSGEQSFGPTGPAGSCQDQSPSTPSTRELPPELRGVVEDVGFFIRLGILLFLIAAGVYFLAALISFASALGSAFLFWRVGKAIEAAVGGVVLLILSTGSLFCFSLGRSKLIVAHTEGDFPALRRRLLPAIFAGLLFGFVLGGLFFLLSFLKLEELPERYRKEGGGLGGR